MLGPNGRLLCRWCKVEVPKGRRRTFCSAKCVHEYRLQHDQGYGRGCCAKRDRGVCAKCGLDAEKLERVLAWLRRYDFDTWQWLRKELGCPTHRRSLWDADHKLPRRDGGSAGGLENLQTLCWWCHRDKTREMNRRPSPEQGLLLFQEGLA